MGKSGKTYLQWLGEDTATRWWHDSGSPDEIDAAFQRGATGITTNPVLTANAFKARPDFWDPKVREIGDDLDSDQRAEALLKLVASYAAQRCLPIFRETGGKLGYALGQLNPNRAGDAAAMYDQAQRVKNWGENICVKLAATGAGVEVVERLAAEGTPVCASVNVSVAQAIAVAEAYERGRKKAESAGIKPGLCIVVQQMGRLEDYLRSVAEDNRASVTEEDIRMSGVAMTKRTYGIFRERGYRSVLMPCAFRVPEQVAEMAGGAFILTLPPRTQKMVLDADLPREERIEKPVDPAAIRRLSALPEFRKAYEPDGLAKEEFIAFGATQKLLSQFIETGWGFLEEYGSSRKSNRWT